MPRKSDDFYNLTRKPTSFEGLDARTGHDVDFHADYLATDAERSNEILEKEIRVRNPALYKLLKAELARRKP